MLFTRCEGKARWHTKWRNRSSLWLKRERIVGSIVLIWRPVRWFRVLLETLVVPIRAGNLALAERYETLLSNSRGLRLIDLDRPLIRQAAQIRALEGLKTPDALQVAAALRAGCTAFLTNDRKIPAVGGLRVLQLQDYL